MSCYLRHLKDILSEAGITVTPANREQIDRALHRAIGVGYKDCPATWKTLKQHLAGESAGLDFIKKLRYAMRP